MIADTVFFQVCDIAMPWPEDILQFFICFTVGILVIDDQRNRCAGGISFKDAGKYFYLVRFLAWTCSAAFAGSPSLHAAPLTMPMDLLIAM